MPVSNTVFLNDPAYSSASYTSGWLNYESTSYFIFTAYCNAGVDLTLDYAVDSTYQIIETETIPVGAATPTTLTRFVKTSFIRFSVINITPPVDLKIQGFFFTSGSPGIQSVIPPPPASTRFTKQLTMNIQAANAASASGDNGYFAGSIGGALAAGFFQSAATFAFDTIIPVDGVLSHFYVGIATAPGPGSDDTYVVYVNNSATAMGVYIPSGSTSESYLPELPVNGGDRIRVRAFPVGTIVTKDTTISCLYTAN